MKKLILFIAAITSMALMADAQVFVGGSASLGYNGGNTTVSNVKADDESKFGISVAPTVGYYFEDNFLAGARVAVSYDRKTVPGTLYDTKTSSTQWGIEPFARYRMGELHNFGLWAECNAFYGRETGKVKAGNTTTDNDPVGTWGINLLPVLTYTVNSHITLETSLNVLSLGYQGSHSESDDGKSETNTSKFSFSADGNDVFGDLGLVNIGFTYKF